MFKTIIFEWKLLLKKRSSLFIILSALLTSISLYILHYSVASSVEDANLKILETNISEYEKSLETNLLQLEDAIEFSDEEVQESIRSSIEYIEEILEGLYNKRNEQWQSIYYYEKIYLTNTINGDQFFAEGLDISQFTYRTTLHEVDWLEEHQLKPFIQQTGFYRFLPNAYDNYEGEEEYQWNSLSKRFSKDGFPYLYLMSESFLVPIMIGFGCLFFGQVFNRNLISKRDLQATLPLSSWKLYVGKLTVSITGLLVFLTLILLAPLAVSFVLADLGSLQYPVLIYELNELGPDIFDPETDPFHFISMYDYFKQSLILATTVALFLIALYIMLSMLIPNLVIRTIIFFSLIISSYLLNFGPYNPFSYLEIFQIVNGQLAFEAYDARYQISTGISVLLIASTLFIVFGFFGFKWRKPGY